MTRGQAREASRYRWLVLADSFGSVALTDGINATGPLFLAALWAHFGGYLSTISGAFGLATLTFGVSSVPVGVLHDRFGPRFVLTLGTCCMGTGLWLLSNVIDVGQLYAVYPLLAFGASCGGAASNYVVVQSWFRSRRGLAMGLVDAGGGPGALLLVPLTYTTLASEGWQSAYAHLALFALAAAPLHFLILRRPASARAHVHRTDWTNVLAAAISRHDFWLLAIGLALVRFTSVMLVVSQVIIAMAAGFQLPVVAAVVVTTQVASAFGKLTLGALSDRTGRTAAFAVATTLIVFGLALLLLATTTGGVATLFAYAVTFGLGLGVSGPLYASHTADAFGARYFGTLYGFINAAGGAGGAVGTIIAALIFESTGSYTVAIIVAAISAVASLGCLNATSRRAAAAEVRVPQ